MNTVPLTYVEFKNRANKLWWQYIETDEKYIVFAYDKNIRYETILYKVEPNIIGFDSAQNSADLNDFETNYKSDSNRPYTLGAVSGQSYFIGKMGEIPDGVEEGYLEWGTDEDPELLVEDSYWIYSFVPMIKEALKGDTLRLEIWSKQDALGAGVPPVLLRTYGRTIGAYGLNNVIHEFKGTGAGKIPSWCTVRLYYKKVSTDLTPRYFEAIGNFVAK